MRGAHVVVGVCLLLALPSALLAQRPRRAADAASKDAAKMGMRPAGGGMAPRRAAIGRLQQRVMNLAKGVEDRSQSGNVRAQWIGGQAQQIQNSLHFGLKQLDQADAIATPAQKRHIAAVRSSEQAALAAAEELAGDAQKPKPDPKQISTVAHRIYNTIQESRKLTAATDDWSS